ncbi:carbohydrate ABC transporter permease [Cellulomonas sp. KRMCY2]|uniref:carbohydrate ABC transporter permease n=1 Tax=Cellulomonas sp. KRMCY2 TaxID=1304865 RepID=UPI0009DD3C9A|nr:sugar ABC transporter permease [Cellulomonas sp. KRMCY2]
MSSAPMMLMHSKGRTEPRRRTKHPDTKVALLMLAPAMILLSIFVLWPLVYAWIVSFYTWSFYEESAFVGLGNFRMVLKDPVFWASLRRGLTFSVVVVPSILVLAFLFANLVKTMGTRMATVLKAAIYIPTVISGVIASIVFVLIYEYRQGVLNWVLSLVGVADTAWLGSAQTALYALTLPAVWLGLGLASLIMLAGLLDIPESYYEAAELEGAGWWQRTIHITLPLMKNILLYLLVTGFVGAIQQYELPLVMTAGGPTQSTLLPNLLIFQHFNNDLYVGYSIAAALLLFLVLGGLSAVIFRLINSEKAVDG